MLLQPALCSDGIASFVLASQPQSVFSWHQKCEQIWSLVGFSWWRGEFHPFREKKLKVTQLIKETQMKFGCLQWNFRFSQASGKKESYSEASRFWSWLKSGFVKSYSQHHKIILMCWECQLHKWIQCWERSFDHYFPLICLMYILTGELPETPGLTPLHPACSITKYPYRGSICSPAASLLSVRGYLDPWSERESQHLVFPQSSASKWAHDKE